MKTLITIDTVAWIDRLRYASDEASLNIHLDPSLSPLSVFQDPGPYAEGTWQKFLPSPQSTALSGADIPTPIISRKSIRR